MADCIFCKIVKKEITVPLLYEDADLVAFNDIAPQAPVHILIVPKTHLNSILDFGGQSDIISKVFRVVQKLVKEKGIEKSGFRIVNNCGPDGGQAVPHIHFHLLGGRKMHWPPG